MPEGPEISYMTYYFNKKYHNHELLSIKVLSGRYSRHPLPENFDKLTKKLPSKIISIKNKGKFIYIELDDNYILGIKLNYAHLVEEFGKQCHIEFKTSKGIFYMDDLRNFATLSILNDETLQKQLNAIGPDLLNEEVTYEEFYEKLKKHPKNKIGDRVNDLKLISTGDSLESSKNYIVGGWGSINPNVNGPKIFNLLEHYITKLKLVRPKNQNNIKILGM